MPSTPTASVDGEFLDELRRLFDDGTQEDAFELLDDYLKNYPHDTAAELLKIELSLEANCNAAFIGEALRRLTAALPEDECLQKLRDQVEEAVRHHLEKGRQELRDRYRRNPHASFKRAMELAPDDPAVPLAAALALLASESDTRRNQRDPVDTELALLTRVFGAGTRAQSEDDDSITGYLARAVEIGPADHPACIEAAERLVQGWIEAGDLTPVFELLEKDALYRQRLAHLLPQVARRTVVLALGYAVVFLSVEHVQQSAQLLDACEAIAPDLALVQVCRAELLVHANDSAGVLAAYQRALALAETTPEPPALDDARAVWELANSMHLVCPRCGRESAADSKVCTFCKRDFGTHQLLIERYDLFGVSEAIIARVGLAQQFAASGDTAAALEQIDIALADLPAGHDAVRGLRGLRGAWFAEQHHGPTVDQPVQAILTTWQRDGLTPDVVTQLRHVCATLPEAAAWTPITADVRADLVRALVAHGDLALARDFLNSAFDDGDNIVDPELRAALETAIAAQVDALTADARRALAAHQPGRALALVDAALDLRLDAHDLYLLRAEVQIALHDTLGAISACRRVLASTPVTAIAHTARLTLARALEARRELDAALTELADLDDPAAHNACARITRRQRGEPVLLIRHSPDMVMHDSLRRVPADTHYTGFFAVTVGAVRRPWSNGNWGQHILDAGLEFVQTLGGLRHQEGDPVFALRLIAYPDARIPERGQLTIALLARVSAPDAARCRTLALDLWHTLRTILPLTQDFVYSFDPVVETDTLSDLLEPFEPDTLAEIVRREDVPGQTSEGYAIYPFTPSSIDLHNLCWTLLRQPAPSMLSIHLLPTDLMPWESAALDRVMLTAPRAEFEAANQATPADPVWQAWQGTQIWGQVQTNRRLVDTLRAGAYVVGLTVAGSSGTTPLLPDVVASSLFGPLRTDGTTTSGGYTVARAITDNDIAVARRNLAQLDVERWVYSAAPEGGVRLRHLLGEGQTALAFRLPIPGEQGLPGIPSLDVKPIAPPANLPETGTILGESVIRISGMPLRIAQAIDDRRRHTYVVGKTGTGKSTLLKYMALQDIEAGHGVCVIDPHGDLVEDILANIPAYRANDVILFDPADAERPIGLNLLSAKSDAEKHRIVTEFIGLLVRMYDPQQQGIVGPRFQHNVRNAMLTAMSVEGNTLIEVVRVLNDTDYVKDILKHVTDPLVRQYWEKQIANTSDFHKSEVLDYIVSKFSRFVGDELVRNIIGQRETTIDFREVMDRRQVLLVNLSKGKIGPESAQFLGLLVVQRLLLTALSRADVPFEQRPDYFLYVDEFQNFATSLFATVLSEGRKYGVAVTVANQYLTQLDYAIREAIFGNVGSIVSFRLGTGDALALAPEMYPTFGADDLLNLPKFTTCTKLLVDGLASRPFTMRTVLDSRAPNPERAAFIRSLSRQRYGRDALRVSEDILSRF